MYYRIIRNDISKSKLITLTTTIFVTSAVMLVSLPAILVVNLSGAKVVMDGNSLAHRLITPLEDLKQTDRQ
ncbi:hypothetical protein [Pseudobacillus badius]|uniref:hypothetical protein n=1 Tax=Bacillus badius TaxID=1455 RepID=UPI0024A390FF|nr:hypothetical protein [Bacillus badius]GLY12282.1 hypothetical protein Bbad01_34980 [Bacillus badius]